MPIFTSIMCFLVGYIITLPTNALANTQCYVQVCSELLRAGFAAAPLQGEACKEDRKLALSRFRSGRVQCLVCTEIAARGLDVPACSHVINFELPTDSAHYLHRAGRCGRQGAEGLVINFAPAAAKFAVRRFGKVLGMRILDCIVDDKQLYLKKKI